MEDKSKLLATGRFLRTGSKRRGFYLNRSRIYHPRRLSRLVLTLSWVYTSLME